jgi:hypothetical protein
VGVSNSPEKKEKILAERGHRGDIEWVGDALALNYNLKNGDLFV